MLYGRKDRKMMCYRDKTFCTYYQICKNGYNCDRALTNKVKKEASEWMKNPPICVYSDFPECFIRFFEEVIK